jgi:hypothetical protein
VRAAQSHHEHVRVRPEHGRRAVPRVVALQAAFERQILKPLFHLIGYRLWVLKVIGYGLWVNLIQPAEPHRVIVHVQDGDLRQRLPANRDAVLAAAADPAATAAADAADDTGRIRFVVVVVGAVVVVVAGGWLRRRSPRARMAALLR